MRVHELAKELNINSKELLEFLSSKNEKIKTSSNSVSEDEIALAKKYRNDYLNREEIWLCLKISE